MAKSTSITLSDHFTVFVDRQIERGRYGSASDVVRDGLRLLEKHEARLEVLRTALIEGEQSGQPEPFDFDAFLADMRAGAMFLIPAASSADSSCPRLSRLDPGIHHSSQELC
jgi:antitoxin ParD1/3/4